MLDEVLKITSIALLGIAVLLMWITAMQYINNSVVLFIVCISIGYMARAVYDKLN